MFVLPIGVWYCKRGPAPRSTGNSNTTRKAAELEREWQDGQIVLKIADGVDSDCMMTAFAEFW